MNNKRLMFITGCCLCLISIGCRAGVTKVPVDAFYTYNLHIDPELSPSGRYLSVRFSDPKVPERNMLVIYDLKTSQRWRVIGMRNTEANINQIFWNVHWVSDNRIIVQTAIRVGYSGPYLTGDIYTLNVKKKLLRLLQGPKRLGVGTVAYSDQGPSHQSFYAMFNILSWMRDDPKHFESIATYPPPAPWNNNIVLNRTPQVYLLDVKNHAKYREARNWSRGMTPNGREIMSGPLPNGTLYADYKGRVRIATGYDKKTGEPIMLYRGIGKKNWKRMPSRLVGSKFEQGPIAFTPDNKSIYMYEYGPKTDTLGLYKLNPNTGKTSLIYDNPNYDILDLIWGCKHEKIVGAELMRGTPKIVVFDSKSPVIKALAAFSQQFKGEVPSVVSTNWNGSKIVVDESSDRDPGRYYLLDTQTMHATFLMKAWPAINPADMARMQPITFKARDGLTIHGYLTLPVGKRKNLPMIVYVHGGPFEIQDLWGFDRTTQMLANRGYAVLQINYRGSGGYGWNFVKAGFDHWGTTMQYDLIDGTRWAIKQGYANPERICIYGASYGGYAALRSAELAPKLYQCTVGYDGVYDLPLMYLSGDVPLTSYGRRYLGKVLGHDDQELKDESPVNHVGDLTGGIFLIQGGEDFRAPEKQVDELKTRLDAAHKKYEYLFKSREEHGFLNLNNERELANRLLAFFNRYIGPDAGEASHQGSQATGR